MILSLIESKDFVEFLVKSNFEILENRVLSLND
jgi:hypothetical protein